MGKICDCCREKIMADFKEKNMPLDAVEAFFAFLEKYSMKFNLHEKPLTEPENASIPSVP